jgi:hypothetical protein
VSDSEAVLQLRRRSEMRHCWGGASSVLRLLLALQCGVVVVVLQCSANALGSDGECCRLRGCAVYVCSSTDLVFFFPVFFGRILGSFV